MHPCIFAPVCRYMQYILLECTPSKNSAGVKPDGGVHVTLSHRIGQLGLLERENAAILNAALQPLAAKLIPAFQQALANTGVRGQLYLTANDGTLLHSQAAMEVSSFM